LGVLAAHLSARPLPELSRHPADFARALADAGKRTGATHALLPPDDVVLAEGLGQDDLKAVDPQAVLAGERIRAIIVCAAMLAKGSLPVAALVPSPRLLVAQAGVDTQDEDALDAGAELCAALARELLAAGASLVVVSGPPEGIASIRRVAEYFGASVVTEADRLVVADLDAGGCPMLSAPALRPDAVVTTREPLPACVDLAALSRAGAALAGGAA
jgi:hypothetical protein